MPARPRPLTLRTGRRQTSSPTALTQRRGSFAATATTLDGGEYNSPGFVIVAGRATSRTTHYKKRNKPRVHSGRGDQQADLQTKTQDSSDPTNPRGSRHSNALACRLTSPTSRLATTKAGHQKGTSDRGGEVRSHPGAKPTLASKSTWHGRGGAPHGHVLRLSERSKKVSPVTL